MGGSMASTPQLNGALAKTMPGQMPVDPNDRGGTFGAPQGLAQLFGQNGGYQQPNKVAQIQAPTPATYQPATPTPIMPTPEMAAATTRQQMLARTPPPMAAPVNAPRRPTPPMGRGGGRGG